MQDWEWEVADSARLVEFLAAYSNPVLSAEERFSLMEILIQCVEDAKSLSAWSEIEPLVHASSILHASTIEYRSCLEAGSPVQSFWVAPLMRQFRTRVS